MGTRFGERGRCIALPLIEDSLVLQAVRNVAHWGDTDIFPFPFENHVFHDEEAAIVKLVQTTASDHEKEINKNPPWAYSTLSPVTQTGFRWATQIDPLWNAYLLALVLSLAEAVERARLPRESETVFSYRIQTSPIDDRIYEIDGWRRFQQRSRNLAEQHKYVVAVDIADFYSRVYHHRLENALRQVDRDGNRTARIMDILKVLSQGTSYGLPVGGPAARVLAELLLNSVDRLMMSDKATGTFCRYADDYRFFVDDTQSAYRAIGLLSEKLQRNEGMSLQKSKTRIMTSKEYLSVLDPLSPAEGTAAAFMAFHIHYDPYSVHADEEYDELKSKMDEFDVLSLLRAELAKGRVHATLTSRLVKALKYIEPAQREQAILSILSNLDNLATVLPQTLIAVRDSLEGLDAAFIDSVHAHIRNLVDDGHPLSQVDLNLQYMIRLLFSRPSPESEMFLTRRFDGPHGFGGRSAPGIQRDIMIILANWNANYWLSDQKSRIGSAHPWVKRAFVACSFHLGDEGKHWRSVNAKGMSPFEMVVRDWAQNKKQNDAVFRIPL